MWAVIKFDKKQFELLKRDFNKKLGKNFIMYAPKLSVQKYKNNKFFVHIAIPSFYIPLICYVNSKKNG